MTTTTSWLQTKDAGQYAFVLAFDGMDLLCTTASSPSEILTAWSGTSWTTCKGNLDIVGDMNQEIQLFHHEVKADSLTFMLTDVDGTVSSTFLAPARESGTYLTAELDNTSLSIQVKSTADFPSTGIIYIGHEAIEYVGKTATAFTGFERGLYSIFTAQSINAFSRRHRIQPDVDPQEGSAPRVTASPRVMYNRTVALYVHHRENGAWCSKANALLLWAGRIHSYEDRGDGRIAINCVNIVDILHSSVLGDQFRATLARGMVLTDEIAAIGMAVNVASAATPYQATTTLNGVGSLLSITEVCNKIAKQLSAWQIASVFHANHRWSCTIEGKDDNERRVAIRMTSTAALPLTNFVEMYIGLSPYVWRALGFDTDNATLYEDSSGRPIKYLRVQRVHNSTTEFSLVAQKSPVEFVDPRARSGAGATFQVVDSSGTWVQQPTTTIPGIWGASHAQGLLQVGNSVAAVAYSDPTFTLWGWGTQVGNVDLGANYGRLDTGEDPPEVKQIWCERGKAGQILLRLLLSTGTSTYNDTTYDVYDKSMGLGIPHSLIDVDSFESLDIPFELYLTAPRSVAEIMAGILASTNRHVIWKDGKITLTYPGFDTPNVADIIELTEDTKAKPDDRAKISYSADGIVNRFRLKHYILADNLINVVTQPGSEQYHITRPTNEYVVDYTPSFSDYGQRRTVEVDGTGVLDPGAWQEYVVAQTVAYFSREMGVIERTFNARVLHMVPSDIVKISDNYLTDPTTGTRGVAGLAAFVLSTSFNWKTGIGTVRLAFMPDHPASRYAKFAPSALVSSYNTGTFTATCSAHAYSRSTEGVDVSYFAVGDKVALIELSPTTAASPSRFTGTLAGVNTGANTMTFTSDITGGAGLTAGKTYVAEYQDYATCVTAQRDRAFICDHSTGKINTTVAANRYAAANAKWNRYATSTYNYTTKVLKPCDRSSQANEPLSAHKIWYAIANANNLRAYKVARVLVNQIGMSGLQVGTTGKMVWGPVKVPLFGTDPQQVIVRKLNAKVLFEKSSNSEAVLYSSDKMPLGSSTTSLRRPAKRASVTCTHSDTVDPAWVDFPVLTPVIAKDGEVAFTWLWLEVRHTSSALDGAQVLGLFVEEAPLG